MIAIISIVGENYILNLMRLMPLNQFSVDHSENESLLRMDILMVEEILSLVKPGSQEDEEWVHFPGPLWTHTKE